jgi:hypothetical protein
VKDLTDQIWELVTRKGDSGEPHSTRRTRTIVSERDSARSARTFRGCESPPVQLSEAWSDEGLFVYEERLAIADALGIGTGPGSHAEVVARREADRAAARVPFAWPHTRGPDAIDITLRAFTPAFGGLTFVRFERREP